MKKIATWNVNSLKVRLPQVVSWLGEKQPDVLCLQETKLEDTVFPRLELEAAGFHAAFAGQRTYNGVAIVARQPLGEIVCGMDGFADTQQRVIAATLSTDAGPLRVVSVYVPNGQAVGSEKFDYKLRWLAHAADWLRAELLRYPRMLVLGDFNVAPEDRDVHNPDLWRGHVLCSEPEREALKKIIAAGFVDVFRQFEQPEKSFSWWDYRMLAFRRNQGLRIDLILASSALAPLCTASFIDKEPRRAERPSDHTPVVVEVAV